MAINQETLRLVAEMRATVDQIADGVTRRLVVAWVSAWDSVVWDLATALDELIGLARDGRWPTRRQIERADRAGRVLEVVRQALDRLAAQARVEIIQAAAGAVDIAAAGTGRIIASQFPAVAGDPAVIAIRFGRVPADQISAIVQRTTQQVTALTWPLSADATEAMKRELVRGMTMGDNPRDAARLMLRRLEGRFNGGLARATNIARTEILDAHRLAAAASQDASSDVLTGWVWTAHLSGTRTCPSCWAKHGTVHPLSEPGPLDHQSGRCSRTPKTKSWQNLGFDVPEPSDATPDARQVFGALPRADQVAIMGPDRLDALQRGDISWDDLSTLRRTKGWRDSYGVTPLKDLRIRNS